MSPSLAQALVSGFGVMAGLLMGYCWGREDGRRERNR